MACMECLGDPILFGGTLRLLSEDIFGVPVSLPKLPPPKTGAHLGLFRDDQTYQSDPKPTWKICRSLHGGVWTCLLGSI